jgi:RNA polymerase sigma factor (sigma-70 family)
VVEDPHVRELPDRELLRRFHIDHDQAAFWSLLRRHGPMVLEVCRGVLGNEADAEDAFQAVFLILTRKAGSIRKAASLGSWLHGVAYRTALKARARSASRRQHEALVPHRPAPGPDDLSWREVQRALHAEVGRLPERYRAALVLCYLEGATLDAAAAQLNLAKSTLRDRLERGRTLLRGRLVRRGLGPAALLVASAWPAADASAGVPVSVMAATAKAAARIAAGQDVAGVISAQVVALTEGVLRTMLLNKLKTATTLLFLTALLCAGLGKAVLTYQTQAAEPPGDKPPPRGGRERVEAKGPAEAPKAAAVSRHLEALPWNVAKIDWEKRTLSVEEMPVISGQAINAKVGLWDAETGRALRVVAAFPGSGLALERITVARDAKVTIDGSNGTFEDVKEGMAASLQFAADKPVITRIHATSRSPRGLLLKKTDAEKNTITVALRGEDVALVLRSDAKYYVNGEEKGFDELKPGMRVELRFGADESRVAVTRVDATGPAK